MNKHDNNAFCNDVTCSIADVWTRAEKKVSIIIELPGT